MYRFVLLSLCLSLSAIAQNTANPSNVPASPPSVGSEPVGTSATPAPSSAPPQADTATTTPSGRAQDQRESEAKREREGKDPLLDLPPLPNDPRVSVIGGKVISVDRIMDRIELQPFGGKKTEIAFDVRTQVSRDGIKIASKEIHPGDRVYADTLLDKERRVFAKSIRVVTKLRDTDRGHGQVIAYDAASGKLTMRDELVSQPLSLHLTRDTVIRKNDAPGSIADLQPGALIAVSFTPGGEGQVQELSVLAVPGSSFIFAGPVTHLDLSNHLLVVSNKTDGKSYDIDYDPARAGALKDVREGADVTVNAEFDGKRYVAQNVSLTPESKQPPSTEH
jgi:hypothetical protein